MALQGRMQLAGTVEAGVSPALIGFAADTAATTVYRKYTWLYRVERERFLAMRLLIPFF